MPFFATVTLYAFNLLPYEYQLAAIFEEGTFLATRWEGEEAVNLYHLPGDVFAELYYDTQANEILRLRSFTSNTPLEAYLPGVRLPQGWG